MGRLTLRLTTPITTPDTLIRAMPIRLMSVHRSPSTSGSAIMTAATAMAITVTIMAIDRMAGPDTEAGRIGAAVGDTAAAVAEGHTQRA